MEKTGTCKICGIRRFPNASGAPRVHEEDSKSWGFFSADLPLVYGNHAETAEDTTAGFRAGCIGKMQGSRPQVVRRTSPGPA